MQPNIVIFISDQQRTDTMACYGNHWIQSPHMNALSERSFVFENTYVTQAVCTPSRGSLMTGLYPHSHGCVVNNIELRDETKTIAEMLPDTYRKAHFGKWHLANDMIPDAPFPSEYGFDEYGAFNCSGPQMYVHDDVKSAIPFIEKSHKADKPFFINLWIHEPHTPFHVDPKLQKRFAKLGEKDAIYAATLFHADLRIGQLLDALDRLKITNNTLVIFSSDNGPARGAPDAPLTLGYDSATGLGYGIAAAKGITGGRKGYKAALFEGGIGVPFIARWPGKIAAGKVDKTSIFSAVDLLPTFCEIAGVKLPASYRPDGVSQVETLQGNGKALREKPLFWKTIAPWPARKTKPDHWVSYAVVSKNWKLVANRDAGYVELYDLVTDPLEKNDLKEKHHKVVKELTKTLEQWQTTLPPEPTGNVFSNLRNPKK